MRIRSMSAGRAGASIYNANVNGEQGGGNKKQGLAPTTNKRVSFVLRAIKRRADSDSDKRRMVYCINNVLLSKLEAFGCIFLKSLFISSSV